MQHIFGLCCSASNETFSNAQTEGRFGRAFVIIMAKNDSVGYFAGCCKALFEVGVYPSWLWQPYEDDCLGHSGNSCFNIPETFYLLSPISSIPYFISPPLHDPHTLFLPSQQQPALTPRFIKTLHELLQKPTTFTDIMLETALEESKRFHLWARNIAALQDAYLPSSLEYRIRNDPTALRAVKRALEYLAESLEISQLFSYTQSKSWYHMC